MNRIRVALVDDHRVVQVGLRSYLESFPDVEVVGAASNGEEALEKVARWRPDVVVMDVRMPGGMDGIETTRRMRAVLPKIKVVVLTADPDDARVVAALRAGAIGFVRKDSEPEVFLDAVRAAAQGRSIFPALTGDSLHDLARGGSAAESLTEREKDVLRQLALGRTNKEIAAALHVSEETVKTHVGNILSKLQLGHRTQAALYALKQGLLSLDEIEG
jgi:NarL family two-component system response regulator LiaR